MFAFKVIQWMQFSPTNIQFLSKTRALTRNILSCKFTSTQNILSCKFYLSNHLTYVKDHSLTRIGRFMELYHLTCLVLPCKFINQMHRGMQSVCALKHQAKNMYSKCLTFQSQCHTWNTIFRIKPLQLQKIAKINLIAVGIRSTDAS